MIRQICAIDRQTEAVCLPTDPGEVATLLANPEMVVWVDMVDPTPEDLHYLAEEFHFHPLALEDCTHRHQRPKVDPYDGYHFMVLYSTTFNEASRSVEAVEVDMFWGHTYVVTVHHGDVADLHQAEQRWRGAGSLVSQGANFLCYLIVDSIVDNYFPVIEAISEQIEDIEEKIFEEFEEASIRRIFTLKKDLIQLRKVVVPLRDVFILLIRRDVGTVDPQTLPYLQDVYDHLIRVADAIDTYRDLISSTIDGYLSTVANRTNEVMRRLTTLATILMTPTLLAGIWGMNFEFMPELHSPYGYPAALLSIVSVVFFELYIFRRLGYF